MSLQDLKEVAHLRIAVTLSVAELIEKLRSFDPEFAVMLWCSHCDRLVALSGVVVEADGGVVLQPGDARDVESRAKLYLTRGDMG